MALSTIAAAVLGFLLVMFVVHEMFKKFFHIVFFVGSALFAIAMAYILLKGA